MKRFFYANKYPTSNWFLLNLNIPDLVNVVVYTMANIVSERSKTKIKGEYGYIQQIGMYN